MVSPSGRDGERAERCSDTWSASSRVGVRMRALIWRTDEEGRGDDRLERICCIMGMPYASVFPEPYERSQRHIM